MPTVLVHHNISKDVKQWLASPKREALARPFGVTNMRTFVDPQNPTRVALLMDVPDMEALTAAMQSQEFLDSAAEDGVVLESVVMLVESTG